MPYQDLKTFTKSLDNNIKDTATEIYDAISKMVNKIPKSDKALAEKVNIIWSIDKANTISSSILVIMPQITSREGDQVFALLLANGWYNNKNVFTPSSIMDNMIYIDKYNVKPDIKACTRITKKVYQLMLSAYKNNIHEFSGSSINT